MVNYDYSKIVTAISKDIESKVTVCFKDKKKTDGNSFLDFLNTYNTKKASAAKKANNLKKNIALRKAIKLYKKKLMKASFKKNKSIWYRYLLQGGCIRMFLMENGQQGPCIRTVPVEDAPISMMSKVEDRSTAYMLKYKEEKERKKTSD